jgi:osmotically inducible protein OsmC
MADLIRKGRAIWKGDLKRGTGNVSSESGAFTDKRYSFSTRFENEPGTNPEELIASAHAACYSMAFAAYLSEKDIHVESIETQAEITLAPKEGGGFEITRMKLHVHGKVPGLDKTTFGKYAAEADMGCPVSNLLRCGLKIDIDATVD